MTDREDQEEKNQSATAPVAGHEGGKGQSRGCQEDNWRRGPRHRVGDGVIARPRRVIELRPEDSVERAPGEFPAHVGSLLGERRPPILAGSRKLRPSDLSPLSRCAATPQSGMPEILRGRLEDRVAQTPKRIRTRRLACREPDRNDEQDRGAGEGQNRPAAALEEERKNEENRGDGRDVRTDEKEERRRGGRGDDAPLAGGRLEDQRGNRKKQGGGDGFRHDGRGGVPKAQEGDQEEIRRGCCRRALSAPDGE